MLELRFETEGGLGVGFKLGVKLGYLEVGVLELGVEVINLILLGVNLRY